MPQLLEDILVSVWRQAMVEQAKAVSIGGSTYPVKHTNRRALIQVDFTFEDRNLRGLEQNPETKSRWAAMAGKKVMQFLEDGCYLAVVVDGKLHPYGRTNKNTSYDGGRLGSCRPAGKATLR
jgi:hypothetical protein